MSHQHNAQETSELRAAPVAATGEIVCASCQRANRANCQFCASCGESLWTECPACAARCAAIESYCSVCGVNRQELIEQHSAAIREALTQSQELATQHDYQRAVAVLHKIPDLKHSQLQPLKEQVRARIAELKAARQDLQTAADESLERATALMQEHAYTDVVKLLDQTPPPFRTAPCNELLNQARKRNDEIAGLIDEIREAAAGQRYMELAPAIERLLTLQPEHRLGRRLAEQLCERLYRKARKQLAEFQYDNAAQLLAAIPTMARDAKVEQLAENVGELVWMFEDLRRAPVISPTVVGLAQRLCKAVPTDTKAVAIHDKLQKLASQPTTSQRFHFPAWATLDSTPLLGCPVKWLTGIRTLRADQPAAEAALRNQPGRFFVALGLALQGLDQTDVKVHLRPAEKQGVLGKFTAGRKQPAASAWGIDLGEFALKAVQLACDPQTGTIAIKSAIYIEHANVANPAHAVAECHSMLAETLAKLRGQVTIEKTDRVCCNLHSQKVLGRFLDLPQTTPKKLAELVKFEAQNAIPCPLEELVLEHHAFPTAAKSAEKTASRDDVAFQQVLLVAAKRQDVKERLRIFEEADLQVDVLQSDALALYNFAQYDCLSDKASSPADARPLAMLDVGTRATNLVLCTERGVWFRTLRFGGVDFTEAIVRPFNLTYEQAEQLKLQPSRARSVRRLYQELDTVLSRFTAELQRTLASYEKDQRGPRVATLLGVGGGFQLHGLLRRLTS